MLKYRRENAKQKKKNKNLKLSNKTKIITFSILLVIVLALLIYSMDLLNLRDSSADSKNYNRTYPAGEIVNYGKTKVRKDSGIYGDDDFVMMKSLGKNIRMPAKPGGPMIKGWRSPLVNSSTYDKLFKKLKPNKKAVNPRLTTYLPDWSYFSKEINIPKDKSDKPLALYVCWRSLSGKETSLKLLFAGPTLSNKNRRELWSDKNGAPIMNYIHRYEHGDDEWQKIKCWGFYDIAYERVVPRSHPQNEPIYPGQYMKKMNKSKSIKARINIKVRGQVEIASIKVFHPTQPPERSKLGANYYDRQFESDITN